MNDKAIELKVQNFLESFKSKDVYNYAITLSPVFKEPDRYIDYRKELAQLLIAVPKLAEYDPKSLIFATAKAYEQGYSFDPKDAEAYFIPYGKEIQFQKGYRGIMKDLMKRPDVVDIVADVVYEDDDIEIDKDPQGRLILKRHKPNPFKRSKDKIIGAYAFVFYKVEGEGIVSNGIAMSAQEIEEDFRSLSKADKSMGKNSFWEKFKVDMYKKTVIKQLRKLLPPLPEETIKVYEGLNKQEEETISPERANLIKQFNEAFTSSGLTAEELRSVIYTKYFVSEPADLTDDQLKEITQELKEKGRSIIEAVRLIGAKEEQELQELITEKQLNKQEEKILEYLGIEPDKRLSTEEYKLVKSFIEQNTKEQILQAIGWEEKKPTKEEQQKLLEDLEYA